MVGLSASYFWFPVGTGNFLHAFFSTISYNLEPNGWGTKYPFLMKRLYSGNLENKFVPALLEEVKEIRNLLEAIPPSKVIWDIEDLSKQPPWGNDISPEITSLANYFANNRGEDLFELFKRAIQTAIDYDLDLKIKSL
ncbi:immunity 70 family protein [Paenibacillus beijingensis]|uniref:Immunity protein 70 n=1 Tax=Paenibacillus beijingensis TaxID=1126833 RepID=A0A0D5NKB5_9BACL|nr:immunity 70 family protein [Paenibacillus beijingensis]AJY75452.1 hypothetical protein VN24_13845 [Paenibacillus beijingensis]